MMSYLLKRAGIALSVAFTVSVVTFVLLYLTGDPAEAIAGGEATEEVLQQIRAEYGLDRPLPVQYLSWLGNMVQGDFGDSYLRRQSVADLIISHAPVTIILAVSALLVTIVVAIPLGMVAALRPNSWVDRFAVSFAVAAQAIPNFWLGLVFIVIFAVTFQWLPVSGDSTWQHFIMPSIVLGLSSVPSVMRLTRTGLIEVMGADFIRTARSKGYMTGGVLVRHAMRNALLPVMSVLAIQLGNKLGGSIITEAVFSLNGLGSLALDSILGADIPTVQMLVFIFALTFVVMTFIADVLNALLDPRIRLG